MPQITESAGTLTAKGGVMRVQIINEGAGASGNYPAQTLEAAAEAKVFHKGLHVHFDHPTVSEATERPERSVLTLAGSLTSDASWNDATKALEADFKPYPSVYDSIKERAEDIGLSIRASAEVEDDGTIARIVSAESVDLVTKAGRGGRILDVIESARREIAERNGFDYTPRHAAVAEATNNDVRSYLSDAVDAAYDTDDQIVFLEDFDDTHVYVRFVRFDGDLRYRSEFRQAYTRDGVNVTLTGAPEEVKPETVFTPTNPEPDSSTATAVENAPTATAGGSMEIKEAEYQRLSEAAERAQALETDRDAEATRADKAEAALAEAERRTEADSIVAEAFEGIDAPKAKTRLVEAAVATSEFDAEAFKTEAEEAASEFAPTGPTVTGFGDTKPVNEATVVSDDDITTALKGAH